MAQAQVSHHFLEALTAMRPVRDVPVPWELLARLVLVAHHPAIASGAATGARAWQLVKHRLSAPVAEIVAGAVPLPPPPPATPAALRCSAPYTLYSLYPILQPCAAAHPTPCTPYTLSRSPPLLRTARTRPVSL